MNWPLPPVLVVDDEKNMRLSLRSILSGEGYDLRLVESAEEALAVLEKEEFFMVITDARLGSGMSGYQFLALACKRWPNTPFLMITAYATPKLAVDAIKSGAMDYLAKPFAPEELLHAVSRCAERHRLLRDNAALRATVTQAYQLDQIIGESGTGKELIAGALHSMSQRRQNNYVRINCAAIPENLLESELFGHEKGSFTGAVKQKLGRVEEAHSGTIFLDEIGDMSRPLQAKLLRFLEDGTFTRVGGNDELKVDVRLIAATNRDIIEAIGQHNFREDLFHRLNVVQFRPPPLRERGEDIVLLAENFLHHFIATMNKHLRGLSESARNKLLSHHWPGNVRELRNVIERAVILEPTPEIQAASLPDFHLEGRLRKTEAISLSGNQSLDELMSEFERQVIVTSLEQNRYNISKTAEQLKLSRHALRYRMQRLSISLGPEDDVPPPG
jgi:DNA-binding NtrC family response regulator